VNKELQTNHSCIWKYLSFLYREQNF